jgi:tetratricopeptide (TPR) repeat protein
MLLMIFVALGVTAWLNRDELQIEAILQDLRAPVAVHEQARDREAGRSMAGQPPDVAQARSDARQTDAPPPQQRARPAVETASAPEPSEPGSPVRPEVPAAQGERVSSVGGAGPGSELEQQWYDARQAYWDGDLAEAERLYQSLIIENPDKADAYGELGNLYYSQGAWIEAAKMYYQAGLLLTEQGASERAGTLVGILTALNPNFADDLQNELDRVSKRGN